MRALLFGFKAIAMKEFLHIRRDRTSSIMALVIPIIRLILFGFALNFDVRHIPTVVVDMDKSQESREYIAAAQNTEYMDMTQYLAKTGETTNALVKNDAHVAIIIPPGFGRDFSLGKKPPVRILVDGSDIMAATNALRAFNNASSSAASAPVDLRFNVLFNPDIRTAIFTIPALVCVLMQMITVALTSFSLVREREQGTLEQ